MTITISEYWLWIALAAMAVSCILSCIGIYLTRKRMALIREGQEVTRNFTATVTEATKAMLQATQAMNDETGSEWLRIKDLKHIDIKSKIIAASSDGTGNDVIQFKNGVTVVCSKNARRTRLDS
jgi:hypothetical protein